MPRKYHAQIIARDGLKYDGQVEYVRLPGADGSFGVMAHHAPLVALLQPGAVLVTESSAQGPRHFACAGGVAEVRDNTLTVLVDAAEPGTEIDVARAESAAQRARERLRAAAVPEVDVDRARAALVRALARLEVAHQAEPRG